MDLGIGKQFTSSKSLNGRSGISYQAHFCADDDDRDRMLFQEVIKDLLSLVYLTMASDGDEAVKILTQLDQLPDIVFLDLNMPFKNGFECLKEIKHCKKLQSIPVIIFSSSTHPSCVSQAYEEGAHLYIRKPNDFLNFKKIVKICTSSKSEK